jgi:hypothetical protein
MNGASSGGLMIIFAVVIFVLWWRGYLASWIAGISGAFSTPNAPHPFSWDKGAKAASSAAPASTTPSRASA